MQEASGADLRAASAQGTILRIKYEGAWYGHGNVGGISDNGSGSGGNSSPRGFQYSSKTFQYSRTSYSFAGFAVLAMGAAAVRVGRRRDNSGDNVQDGEDTYIEMAEPR